MHSSTSKAKGLPTAATSSSRTLVAYSGASPTNDAFESTPLLPDTTASSSRFLGRASTPLVLLVLLAVFSSGYISSAFYNNTSAQLAAVDRYRDKVQQELADAEAREQKRVDEAWNAVDQYRQSVHQELDDLKRQTHYNITVEWRRLDTHRDEVTEEVERLKHRKEAIRHRIEDMKETERQEDERRKSLRLYWDVARPDVRCSAYATRYYSSELKNLPGDKFDALGACYKTPNTIHGVEYSQPSWCEQGNDSTVFGYWRVTSDALCKPWWSSLTDKGCTAQGSRLRRWEQHMENLANHEDWLDICQTMPANFNGKHFSTPTYCADWGHHGIFGVWIVQDDTCR